MIEWIDKHLVENWREAWRWASVRGAGAFAAVVGALAANPDLLLSVIAFMPTEATQRAFMAVGVALVAFFGPTILRVWRQGDGTETAE